MGNTQEKSGKKILVFEDDKDQGSYDELKAEVTKACKCSLKVRMTMFCICFALGWLMSILAVIVYFTSKDVTRFAVLYGLGQSVNLAGTFFLAGPLKQLKLMTQSKRILVSLLYVSSTVGTVLCALLLPHMVFLTVACLIVQVVSYFFYCLTYIPFGQKMLKQACSCCIKTIAE